MKRSCLWVALAVAVAGSVDVLAEKEGKIYVQAQQFEWKEFSSGSELLKESGLLYGVVLEGEDWQKHIGVGGKVQLFGGGVDYDGSTMSGTEVASQTDYMGVDVSADVRVRINIGEHFCLKPFAGIGIRYWNRELGDTESASGYTETWSVLDGRAGLQAEWWLAESTRLYAKGGCRVPLTVTEEVDLSEFGLSTVSLEPKQQVTPYAEVGLHWKYFMVGAFYENLEFDQSDSVTEMYVSWPYMYTVELYQPESKSEIWGVNLGFVSNF